MPKRTKRPCRNKLCSAVHRNANGFCDEHQRDSTNWGKWQHRKGNERERGYDWNWRKLAKQIRERDCNLCQTCKRKGKLVEAHAVDHIKPKAQGGTDAPSNLECICKACHKAKTAMERRGGGG